MPFDQVTAEHAAAEGEGDLTLASWRAEHERFWRTHAASGFAPDMPVVCEAFRVVHRRSQPGDVRTVRAPLRPPSRGDPMSRVHVVTGAGSGIGAATAAILREKGETVVGVDLKGAEVTADLSTPEGRAAAVKDVLAATDGRVDTVIACAGISAPSALTVSVNHYGVVAFLDALRPTLAESSTPRAAVVSSMSSLQPNHAPLVDAMLTGTEADATAIAEQLAADPRAGGAIYASTKRAISRWGRARSIPAEWAGAGIP